MGWCLCTDTDIPVHLHHALLPWLGLLHPYILLNLYFTLFFSIVLILIAPAMHYLQQGLCAVPLSYGSRHECKEVVAMRRFSLPL